MKFAKRIFVGILAVAMLVACVAFPASAEAPELPVKNLYDLFEYFSYDTYVVEDYQDQTGESYVFAPTADEQYFEYIAGDAQTSILAKANNAEDKYLKISNNSAKPVGYKMYPEEGAVELKDLVASFDFMSGDASGAVGSDFSVSVALGDYFEEITLFAVKTADNGDMNFIYADYNEERVTYSTLTSDAVVELGAWYHVEIVYVLGGSEESEMGSYSIIVKNGEDVVLSYEDVVDKSAKGIDSIRVYLNDSADAGATVTSFDEFAVYEGTSVRNVKNSTGALIEYAKKVDEYAKHDEVSLESKIEVANFYADFYGGPESVSVIAPDLVAEGSELKPIYDGWEAYRNTVYATALIEYTKEFNALEGYYAKLEYREELVDTYYAYFDNEEYVELPGVKDNEELQTKILEAKQLYEKVCAELELKKQYSIAFIKSVEENYDPENKDFGVMKAKYASLSALVSKVDPEFDYTAVNKYTKYPTVADALSEYRNLGAKITAIIKNASEVFMPAVEKMEIQEAETVSAESPYRTTNFEELYGYYLTAKSVYFDGSVHESLDPATYVGLSDAIAKYQQIDAYIQSRIDESSAFVAAINGADSSFYYATIVSQLAEASLYLDNNIEKSLEKYTGVADAIVAYSRIIEELEQSEKDADAYIAAVEAINVDAEYSVLKAAVSNATALKAKFNLIGYAGLEAANTKFAIAESKVVSFEGNSSTLLSAVAALENAKTLSERRTLIYIAKNAESSAESSLPNVSAAKAALADYIAQYNADVARVNALFAGVVANGYDSISSVAPTDSVNGSADAAAALLK